ncbi:response regulator [Paenibacillus sp. N1-5-1-14]|uniref:helix-turn-helix domain-containing protein n=1 Tax=Paenibacillus radicibacter TaxID=2972488 RepID=UPI002158F1E7|nr:helix-turn-helix domain-containing protein [Paenibacillus radicibacter]MCR8642578.1 response regulator [Paenibacillus radicibacter]
MLTAIVVDDDYPVLQYLSQAVKWEKLNIQLIGCYSNGLEAWENTGGHAPDIIVTDIGMPKMDGLEMLQKFNETGTKYRAVILSCHDDFHYAKKAMQLNASDYMLKESLDVEQLQQILRKICDQLSGEKTRNKEMQQYQEMRVMNESALRAKLLKDTLQQQWKKEDWIQKAEQYGMKLQAKYYIPMVITVDRLSEAMRVRRMNDHTIIFAIENVLQDMLEEEKTYHIFQYSSRELVILHTTDDPNKQLQQIQHQMQSCLITIHNYLKISVSCLIGRAARNPEEIRSSIVPMMKESEHCFYMEEGRVWCWERVKFALGDMYAQYAPYFTAINECIALHKEEQLRKVIADWENWVTRSKFHPDEVKEWSLQLLLDLQMKLKVTLQFQQTPLSEEKLHRIIHAIQTMKHLAQWLAQYLCDLSGKLSSLTISSKRTEVIKAQQYVISRLTERITLEEMAQHLNLNASYFSRLFKRETNHNFIEYVNQVKLQKAKELMQQSNMTVDQISDYLGYSNKSYFIKLFKRDVGMRPSEFVAWD